MAVVIAGLVAMHHLVALGCESILNAHQGQAGHSMAVEGTGGAFALPHLDQLDSSPRATSASHDPHPSSLPAGDAGTSATSGFDGGSAAIVCLAVLAALMLLARGSFPVLERLSFPRRDRPAIGHLSTSVQKPPDLTLLSVSRT